MAITAGFNGKDFSIDENFQEYNFNTGRVKVPTLNVYYKVNNGYFFSMHLASTNFHVSMSPGNLKVKDSVVRMSVNEIDWTNHVWSPFKTWLTNLKREVDAESEWNKIFANPNSYNFDENFFTNDKFSDNEKKEVKRRISQLRNIIAAKGLPKEQIEAINDKMDMLLEKTNELSKFDWRSLVVGTFLTLLIALKVDKSTGIWLWNELSNAFSFTINLIENIQ